VVCLGLKQTKGGGSERVVSDSDDITLLLWNPQKKYCWNDRETGELEKNNNVLSAVISGQWQTVLCVSTTTYCIAVEVFDSLA